MCRSLRGVLRLGFGFGWGLWTGVLVEAQSLEYVLREDVKPEGFFDHFEFYTGHDPTNGFVQYVNRSYAEDNGLIATYADHVTVGVDTSNVYDASGPGRPSVRLEGKSQYTHGLFILRLAHMPYGCGTWPAFWTLGPDWPNGGEIDIIEGVNSNTQNLMTLHTDAQCTIAGANETGTLITNNCDVNSNGNQGCSVQADTTSGYGELVDGTYAMEWSSSFIRVWYFNANDTPDTVVAGTPDPSTFGVPRANFQGSCDIDEHFNMHKVIFDNTFCGDWAGNAYASSGCPLTDGLSSMDSCKQFVAANPQSFEQAYWNIKSLKIYQAVEVVSSQSQSPSQTPIPSPSPSSSSISTSSAKAGSSTTISASTSAPFSYQTSKSTLTPPLNSTPAPASTLGSNSTLASTNVSVPTGVSVSAKSSVSTTIPLQMSVSTSASLFSSSAVDASLISLTSSSISSSQELSSSVVSDPSTAIQSSSLDFASTVSSLSSSIVSSTQDVISSSSLLGSKSSTFSTFDTAPSTSSLRSLLPSSRTSRHHASSSSTVQLSSVIPVALTKSLSSINVGMGRPTSGKHSSQSSRTSHNSSKTHRTQAISTSSSYAKPPQVSNSAINGLSISDKPHCHSIFLVEKVPYRIYCNATVEGVDLIQSNDTSFTSCVESCDRWSGTSGKCIGAVFSYANKLPICMLKRAYYSRRQKRKPCLVEYSQDTKAALRLDNISVWSPDDPQPPVVKTVVAGTSLNVPEILSLQAFVSHSAIGTPTQFVRVTTVVQTFTSWKVYTTVAPIATSALRFALRKTFTRTVFVTTTLVCTDS